MSTLRTESQLAAELRISVDVVRDWLVKSKLRPVAEFPYGKGMARLFNKSEALEAIRPHLERHEKAVAKKVATTKPTPRDDEPKKFDGDVSKDVHYLVGVIDEQQEQIKQLLAGHQMMFKHLQGMAHQLDTLVRELGVKAS